MMLVYVSGPYSGEIDRNIQSARRVAIKLWEAGYAVLCPHLNTAHLEVDSNLTYEQYLKGDLEMVARCDAVVLLPSWKESRGAVVEKEYAERIGIPCVLWPNLPRKSPTEDRCPKQCREFLEIVMRMYRLHLTKNEDYSAMNILMTGEIGLLTRLWDKVARLLNLAGFRFKEAELLELGAFEQPKSARHESVEDAYLDLAVYGIIGLLLRRGVWGK